MVGDSDVVTVLLGGDVMLGRGLDQILLHPGEPELRGRICVMREDTSGWPSARTGRFRTRWIGSGPGARC
jgi:hypothetical protein